MGETHPAPAEAERRGPRLRHALLAAAALALVAGWLAPDPWPDGPGVIVVTREGETIARAEVAVGADQPVRLRGRVDGHAAVIEFPRGTVTRSTPANLFHYDGPVPSFAPDVAGTYGIRIAARLVEEDPQYPDKRTDEHYFEVVAE